MEARFCEIKKWNAELQCDQMARLDVQYLSTYNTEN